GGRVLTVVGQPHEGRDPAARVGQRVVADDRVAGDSVSSVSLDEEMTDMIKFQQAYNASARMMTMMDEMLDKIINGMGTVGR
ncbi:flagellar basal body rod C-terminal domain-containing protein, partial [Peribacillus sp. NPDC060186]